MIGQGNFPLAASRWGNDFKNAKPKAEAEMKS
jgi:hypothetical protein